MANLRSLNKVFLLGNMTRDPELKYTQSGGAVCKVGLAVNRRFKSGTEWKEEVAFVDVECWGKTAEKVGEYCKKGSGVLVEGRLKLDTWQSKEGEKRSKLLVVAENIQFADDARKTAEGGGSEGTADLPAGGGSETEEAPFH